MRILGAAVVIVTLSAIFGLGLLPHEITAAPIVFDPPFLLPTLNTVFIFFASFAVAFIAWRTYLATGMANLLLMGCGALVFGLASLLAGWGIKMTGGPNVTVTLHNCGAFFGAGLHLVGAILTWTGSAPETRRDAMKANLLAACAGPVLLVLVLLAGSLAGFLPPFIAPDGTPTLLRQTLLSASVVLFAFTSFLFFMNYRRSRAPFLYWYSLGLAMIALGLVAIFLSPTVGNPVSWLGRTAQYVGGIFLFVAVTSAVRAARAKELPVQQLLAEVFRKPRDFHAALLETVTDAIVSIDREGRVLLWNRASEKMFGFTQQEATGSALVDLIAPGKQAGDLPALFARPGAHQEEDAPRPVTELVLKRKSGKHFPAEMTVSGTMVSGQWIGTFAFRDITVRKRAEAELRESEKETKRLAEENTIMAEIGRIVSLTLDIDEVYERFAGEMRKLIPFDRIGITIVDVEKGTGFLSYIAGRAVSDRELGVPYSLEGTAIAEMIRTKSAVLVQTDDLDAIRARFPNLLSTCEAGFRSIMNVPLLAKGQIIGALLLRSVQPDAYKDKDLRLAERVGRQIAGAVANARLYAERMRLMDALRASRDEMEKKVRDRTDELARRNEELQNFAFIASHDLQEPLRKIRSFGDLLAGEGAGSLSEEGRDYVERMQKAASRMQNLLDSLLSYSRVTIKARPFTWVDLGKAAKEALSNLEIQILETGGRVEVGELPGLHADEAQMVQLFQNLIANALKFASKGVPPRVSVYSGPVEGNPPSEEEARHHVFVKDNGIGFDEKYLDRIFSPFERLHGRGEYPGVGMGLAICRKIAERHGGSITAESEPGKGSTFIITLPERPD